MRFGLIKVLILSFLSLSGLCQQRSDGNPFQRHREPVVYIDKPQPLGGFAAIQSLIVYPDTALALQLEGTVILKCIIDIDGRPRQILPLLGPEILFNAAIDAVELSHWLPARLDGEPIAGEIQFALEFHLPGSEMNFSAEPHPAPRIRHIFHNLALSGLLVGVVLLLRASLF